MSDDWTEKYRPKTLKDVIGNPSATNQMLAWAKSWTDGVPSKKALVLMGSPGVGKTTSAEALARDMGWGIVEMNASDQRTGTIIRDIAIKGSSLNTFDDEGNYLDSKKGKMKLIVLDEADSLFGNADRGALPVINELIKTTKQPVILIVNDFYALSKKSSAIKTNTLQITFKKIMARSVVSALTKIAAAEKVKVDMPVLQMIAENSHGDMRAAVRDLESLALGVSEISFESAEDLSERNSRKDMYALVEAVFRKNDPKEARNVLSKTDSDPDTALMWIDENLPYEYSESGDLVRGYEKLSRADIYLGRVHRRQYYGFWSYASEMMTMGVATSKRTRDVYHGRIRFPTYLLKMSQSRNIRGIKSVVSMKLAVYNHTSTKRVENDILPSVKYLCKNDSDYCIFLTKELMLEPEELAFLLDTKIDSPAVKGVIAATSLPKEKPTGKKISEPEEEIKQMAEVVEDTDIQSKNQSNLFDF